MIKPPLDIPALLARRIRFERTITPKDVILYHLGLGYGAAPHEEATDLQYVYERQLTVLPTFATTLMYGPRLIDDNDDFDLTKMLHGAQAAQFHRPVPIAGQVECEMRIEDIVDKGSSKGCIIVESHVFTLKGTGEKLATLYGTAFYRGDGGRGGTSPGLPRPPMIPDRAPDRVVTVATRPEQAMLYRLSGDLNPLHIDPVAASAAGFARPILHGLCSYGIACRALVASFAPGDPDRVTDLSARLSSPVYPGETLIIECWQDGAAILFRCTVRERGVVVLDNGRVVFG